MTKPRSHYPNAVSNFIFKWVKDDFAAYEDCKKISMGYYRRTTNWEKLYRTIAEAFPGGCLGSLKKLRSKVYYYRNKVRHQQHNSNAPNTYTAPSPLPTNTRTTLPSPVIIVFTITPSYLHTSLNWHPFSLI